MNKFFDNGTMAYRAEISRPPFPLDAFHVQLTSQFRGAKDPNERHVLLDMTLSRESLEKLCQVIEVHLATFGAPPDIEGVPV